MPQGPIPSQGYVLNNAKVAAPLHAGQQGDQYTSSRHGVYYNPAYLGMGGLAANPSGVTTSAGLATTYVGICLSNPAGSTVNLEILRVSGSFIVAPATVTGIGLITGYAAGGITAHTTPLTVQTSLVGPTASTLQGLVDSACTLVGTPVWSAWLAETPLATTLPVWNVDLEGSIIIAPGGYIAIGTTIAGPSSGFVGGFCWAEAPL